MTCNEQKLKTATTQGTNTQNRAIAERAVRPSHCLIQPVNETNSMMKRPFRSMVTLLPHVTTQQNTEIWCVKMLRLDNVLGKILSTELPTQCNADNGEASKAGNDNSVHPGNLQQV